MNIQIRVLIKGGDAPDKALAKFRDKIHKTIPRSIISELKELPPKDSGTMRESWVSDRTDPDTTLITNEAEHSKYLLGTGMWGPYKRCFFRTEAYWWRAANRRSTGFGFVRGINPHKIARSINEETLVIRNIQAQKGEIGWDVDDYKQDTYDFIYELNSAIKNGLKRGKEKVV
jgi:hypothetical protein